MAFLIAKHCSLFLVLISLLSSHAREFQYFSKTPAKLVANKYQVTKEEPNLMEGNMNGQKETASTQHPSASNPFFNTNYETYSTVEGPPPPPLPSNYNPVAYVTKAEGTKEPTFDTEKEKDEEAFVHESTTNDDLINSHYESFDNHKGSKDQYDWMTTDTETNHPPPPLPSNYNPVAYVTKAHVTDDRPKFETEQEEEEEESIPSTTTNDLFNSHYESYETFSDNEFADPYDPTATGDNTLYNSNRVKTKTNNNFRNNNYYGMSDTRKVSKGKYFYDVAADVFPHAEHPYNKFNNYRNTKAYNHQVQEEDVNMP